MAVAAAAAAAVGAGEKKEEPDSGEDFPEQLNGDCCWTDCCVSAFTRDRRMLSFRTITMTD